MFLYEKNNNSTYENNDLKEGFTLIINLSFAVTALHILYTIIRHVTIKGGIILVKSRNACLVMLFILTGIYFLNYIKKNNFKNLMKMFFTLDQVLLISLAGFLTLSCGINSICYEENLFVSNIDHIYDVLVTLLVIYPLGRYSYYCSKRTKQSMLLICHIILISITVAMLFILINVFQNINIETEFVQGIGMDYHKGRLSINQNPNVVGGYVGLFFLICLFFAYKSAGVLKAVYVTSSIVHFFVLVLCNSRGAFVGVLVSTGVIGGLTAYYAVQNSVKKFIHRLFIGAIFCICTMCVLSFFRIGVMVMYDTIASGFSDVAYSSMRDLNITYTSGRVDIWKKTLQLIFADAKTFLFGVSPRKVWSEVGAIMSFSRETYTHNQFTEIWFATGGGSLLVYFWFLLRYARDCINIGFHKLKEKWYFKILPLIVLYLVIYDLTEAYLMYYDMLMESVFFFLGGWCYECVKTNYPQKVYNIQENAVKGS